MLWSIDSCKIGHPLRRNLICLLLLAKGELIPERHYLKDSTRASLLALSKSIDLFIVFKMICNLIYLDT